MTAVGMLVGFRFHAGIVPAAAMVLLIALFGLAFSWISALIGLAVRDVESVQAASFIWIFPLTFASSAFVPVQGMPGWLQAFAKVNPITISVDAMRALALGGPTATHVWQSLAWTVGILVVFVPLAVRKYRRNT
jgi:ABC-2 type transport system permease protein/oleandomycin transport system permease protein